MPLSLPDEKERELSVSVHWYYSYSKSHWMFQYMFQRHIYQRQEGTKLGFKCQSSLQKVTDGCTPGKGQTFTIAVQGLCGGYSQRRILDYNFCSYQKCWNILKILRLFSDFLLSKTFMWVVSRNMWYSLNTKAPFTCVLYCFFSFFKWLINTLFSIIKLLFSNKIIIL